jgi:hypothetical protein
MAQVKDVGQDPAFRERQWRERVDAWRGSGQTQRAFCKARGISGSSFSRWKAELARRDQLRAEASGEIAASGGSTGRRTEALGWTEVGWPSASAECVPEGSGFEVFLPRGRSVRLGPRFEAESLRRLLAVLEERSC